jgi:SAM-dependent methyltransferase
MDQMDTYFRPDLARVHEDAFGFHADNCVSGILDLLAPVRDRGGLVLEIGCGTGLLTRHLVGAGHRVVATDASEAMLAIARTAAPDADVRRLTLPDDPLPAVDAIVGVGHVLNYLGDESAVQRALAGLATALRPGGILAIDLCDLAWGTAYRNAPTRGRVTQDWAMITEFVVSRPDRFAFQFAVFTPNDDGSWRRDDERHDLVLLDTAGLPAILRQQGIDATIGGSFGSERLPPGLVTLVGGRADAEPKLGGLGDLVGDPGDGAFGGAA